MKILVFGAGAVGSTLGGMLALGGHSVTLVGRNPHMARIAASGLKISGLWGTHHVTSLQTALEIPADADPDLILLTTKSYDTESAARLLAQRFPKNPPVLHLQNGVGNAERLIERLGAERVISGVIIVGFEIPMAGRSVVTVVGGPIQIGRLHRPPDDVVKNITEVFRAAHLPTESTDRIHAHLWGKLLYNAALNPLGGILGVPYGQLLEAEPWSIIERVIHEIFGVLRTLKEALLWDTPEDYLTHLKTVQIPATFDHKPSMLSDLAHGRRTEIEALNGAVTALARRAGVPTPVNDTLVSLVRELEKIRRQTVVLPAE